MTKQLSDISTFRLIQLCKGEWNLDVNIHPSLVTEEVHKWLDNCKIKIIENFKEELHNRLHEEHKVKKREKDFNW